MCVCVSCAGTDLTLTVAAINQRSARGNNVDLAKCHSGANEHALMGGIAVASCRCPPKAMS